MALTVKIKKAHVIWAAVVVAAGAAGFGFLEFSSTNTFCYLCHFDARFQEPWRASAHFKEGVLWVGRDENGTWQHTGKRCE